MNDQTILKYLAMSGNREMHDYLEKRLSAGGDAKNPRCRDAIRLDWLADPDNRIGNVQLPVGAVIENVGSLRDAIDAAMSGDYERNAPLVEPGYLENDQVELPPNGGSESNSGAVGG